MAQRGLDVEKGETWAFNELTPEVLEGAPGARAEVLEFMRGLYDGAPGMPKARGIVFNIWVPSTTDAAEVAAYKASLRAWLMDEAFWSELDRYVDVFAHEVYVSALSWGVGGTELPLRAKRLNEYFQHMAVLADDAPKSFQAARDFLHRTYLPLANAAWPHSGIGDTHLLDDKLMQQFVSAQVYALRRFAEAHPRIVPQGLIGFALGSDHAVPGLLAGRQRSDRRAAGEGHPRFDRRATEHVQGCVRACRRASPVRGRCPRRRVRDHVEDLRDLGVVATCGCASRGTTEGHAAVTPEPACGEGRFRQRHRGDLSSMNRWRYALFGWVAWKVTKRYVRRKMP